MKIKNIKINSYGKLKEKEINLQNNINIIYGKNESGKSTLLNYIKNMFYGISKNKNGKEISDYEKFIPWEGENFSGKIEYILEDGNKFEIYRDFHKKNPKIFNECLEDISSEFKIDKKDGNLFFSQQTGVSEQTYVSTIMSAQQELILNKASQNVLVQKIANLGGTGDDKVSFQKAIERLNKRQLEEVGTNRTQDRPINLLQNRKEELEFVKKEEKLQIENKQNLEIKKLDLEQKKEEEENRNNAIRELNMLTKEFELEQEKNSLKDNIKKDNNLKVEKIIQEKKEFIKNNSENYLKQNLKNNVNDNIEKKSQENLINDKNEIKNKLNKKIKTNKLIFIIVFLSLIILNIYNFIFIKNKIIYYLLLFLFSLELIIIIFLKLKNNNKIKQLEKEIIKNNEEEKNIQENIKIYDSQIKLLKEEIEKQEKEIEKEKNKINKKINLEKQKIKEKYLHVKDIEYLLRASNEELEKILENSNQKMVNYKLELNRIDYEEKNILEKIEEYISLKEEQEYIEEQLDILEQKNKCFNLTKEFLEKAYNKMKNNVTPKFTKNLSNIIKNISNGKYKKVTINEEKGLIVELENGEYIPANLLSTGTIDQLYLALRLSMLDEISQEKLPIILDEPFAYFDDERLKNILEFLYMQAKEHQIILFTCTNREKEIFDSLKINYQWIEL